MQGRLATKLSHIINRLPDKALEGQYLRWPKSKTCSTSNRASTRSRLSEELIRREVLSAHCRL
jgi:hypothetical protein